MHIEDKSQGLEGDAVIGRVTFAKSGRSVHQVIAGSHEEDPVFR